MSDNLVTSPVSGLMGLAFEALASTQAPPFWQAVTSANLLSSPEMSFWLAREPNSVSASFLAPGGTFTLGGTNSTLFSGDIEYIDLVSSVATSARTFWLLGLSGKFSVRTRCSLSFSTFASYHRQWCSSDTLDC